MKEPVDLMDEVLAKVIDNQAEGKPVDCPIQILNPTEEETIPLRNRGEAAYVRQQELPHHRVFAELSAKGYSSKEIATMTGFSPVCVQDILRQPGQDSFLAKEIKRNFGTDQEVVEVIKGAVVDSVKMLAGVVNDTKAKGSDRIAAAKELLDRRYGKCNQPINRGTEIDLNSLPDSELVKMLSQN